MSEIVVFNDLHLADKPPRGRTESYTAEGLALLSEVVEVANLRGAEAIVSTGDLFHIKTPWRNSHWLVQQTLGLLLTARCPVYVVPGNHDMTELGMKSLAKQPLGVLHQAGAIRILHSQVPVWVYTESSVRLIGREYDVHRDADPTYYALREAEGASEPTVMFAHGSIIPWGQERPYPTVHLRDLNPTGINVLVSGHIHEDLGIQQCDILGDGHIMTFANVGALGRVARTEANLTRTVKMISIHDGREVEEIPMKSALPAEEAFIETVEETVDMDAIQQFVASLRGAFGAESVDLLDLVQQADVNDTVRKHLLRFLEEAGA